MAFHVSLTWLAMCHPHGSPCVTHMARHVSPTWLDMCRPHGSTCVSHMARHVSPTWLAMCRPHGSPCVAHMARHVSPTWLAMCPVASKNVKFRLSQNSMKFSWTTKFRETNPTMRSVLSSEISKTSKFSTYIAAASSPCLPLFFFFWKSSNLPGFTFFLP